MADKELLQAISAMLEQTLKAELDPIKTDISEMKTDMQNVKADIIELKTDMQNVKADIIELKTGMQNVKADIIELKTGMQNVEAEIIELNSDMQLVKKDIRSIELTVENETNRNISIIAEGHSDLNRKLDEALKSESEKEMLLLRVNRLENELRKIKERLEVIA